MNWEQPKPWHDLSHYKFARNLDETRFLAVEDTGPPAEGSLSWGLAVVAAVLGVLYATFSFFYLAI